MRYTFICGNQIEPINIITTDTKIISNPTEIQIDSSTTGKPLIEEAEPIDIEKYHYVYEDGDTQITKKWVLNPMPTKEEILSSKVIEFDKTKDIAIEAGFSCDAFGTGKMLHYTLTPEQQNDLKIQITLIQNGAKMVLWHDDSKFKHDIYTVEQFKIVYANAFTLSATCKVKSDMLKTYVQRLLTEDKLSYAATVTWSTALPEDLAVDMENQIHIQLISAGVISETVS